MRYEWILDNVEVDENRIYGNHWELISIVTYWIVS